MKIFCHIPRENWFGDRYGAEYSRASRYEVSHEDLNCDLIWLLADWCWRQIPAQILKEKPVVCTVHHIVPEKFDQKAYNEFMLRDQFVDAYHVPCDATKDFISGITTKPIKKIVYWVDLNLWPSRNRDDMKKKFDLPKNALVVGSFQRDTEGHDLKSPKLEKGPDRFCSYVEMLVAAGHSVHVLLNGWRRQYVISRLSESSIPVDYIELPSLSTVSEMYSACDLYVVGSRYEGGPQAILECAASRTPIVSADVGIATDVLPGTCIWEIGDIEKIYFPTDHDVNIAYENAKLFEISKHVKEYDKLFDEVRIEKCQRY